MSKLIEWLMNSVYFYLKLSFFYLVLCLLGGIILGVAPASAALMSAYSEHKMNFDAYHFKDLWDLFKKAFKQANQVACCSLFFSVFLTVGLLIYVQLSQSFFILFLTIINLFLLVLTSLIYVNYLKLQVYYMLSLKNVLKLTFIACFIAPLSAFKVIVGTVCLAILAYHIPAVFAILLPMIWHQFVFEVTDKMYEKIDERLVTT